MSSTWEALMHIMRSRVSFFEESSPASTTSSQSPSKEWRFSKQPPSEAADSYFPERTPSPTSSSETEDDGPTPAVAKASRMIGAEYPIPPLEREYSPPTEELDVAQQLAKKPLPRSLHSSLQRAASQQPAKRPVDDEETKRQKLAAAKKELLALAGQV
ncbi:hypothetical protein F5Y11DRAFT_354490 [Daldinia sp. FL1419]|nr:hypothetical protein F5Y11DRAFT_354490 [Daldinia sp. FL1419]